MNRFGLLLTGDTCLRSDAEFSGLRHSHIDKAPKSGQLRAVRGRWDGSRKGVSCVLYAGGGMGAEKRSAACAARGRWDGKRKARNCLLRAGFF